MESVAIKIVKSFDELMVDNPCDDCPAPCCRMLISPSLKPQNILNVDHMRYSLLFPNTELVISITGEFSFIRWQACSLFLQDACKCAVHGTSKKPLTCVHFNPHNCWYKRNFVGDDSIDLCRLNLERFEHWTKHLDFDERGNLIAAPNFAEMKALLGTIAITPSYKSNRELSKTN